MTAGQSRTRAGGRDLMPQRPSPPASLLDPPCAQLQLPGVGSVNPQGAAPARSARLYWYRTCRSSCPTRKRTAAAPGSDRRCTLQEPTGERTVGWALNWLASTAVRGRVPVWDL